MGDAVHNIRSALDHVAWALACSNRKTEIPRKFHREIYFPIGDTYEAFMTHPTIRFLTLDQIAVLEKYQPFPGRNDKRLSGLNALWNADKHQVINVDVDTLAVEIVTGHDPKAPSVDDVRGYFNLAHEIIEECERFFEPLS